MRRLGRLNIDQLLREGLVAPKPEAKGGLAQVENALRIQSSGFRGRHIVFTESPTSLQAAELIDFSKVEMLQSMDAFVGASSGVLKGLTLNKSSFVNFRLPATTEEAAAEDVKANATRTMPISALSFAGPDQTEVLVGRGGGQVDLFNYLTETFATLFEVPNSGSIKGVHAIEGDRIVVASSSGSLSIWEKSGKRLTEETWTAGEDLQTMRLAPGEANVVATGGKENPLKLWNIGDQKCVFTAKNVRPDHLELRVPVMVQNCRFVDDSAKNVVTSDNNQIRLYDIRAQRRPVLQETWLEEPIQALSNCSRDWHVLAGNNRGEVGLFDIRSTAKSRVASKYKGFAGAVKSIDAHPSEPHILSCGVDRFAILHNLNTKEVVRKIYCKVQLNCCLLRDDNLLLQPSQAVLKSRKRMKEGQ